MRSVVVRNAPARKRWGRGRSSSSSSALAWALLAAVGWMEPSQRRSLQHLPRSGPDQPRGLSSSPVRKEPEMNLQEEKPRRKSTLRRTAQVTREDFEMPAAAPFKPLCPAKPSPSFLELPSTPWRPNAGLPHTQAARIGKGKRHFSPDHQPQECFGLLECMHNNIQTQTQIAQAQLSLLEDMRESMNILLSRQERQNHDLVGQLAPRPPKGPASSPHPDS